MNTAAKKSVKINARDLAESIRGGASDEMLQAQFGLSPEQVVRAKQKLIEKGLISNVTPLFQFTCPACGKQHPREVAECSDCGVIIAKYKKAVERKVETTPQVKPEKRKPSMLVWGLVSLLVLVLIGGGLFYKKVSNERAQAALKEQKAIVEKDRREKELLQRIANIERIKQREETKAKQAEQWKETQNKLDAIKNKADIELARVKAKFEIQRQLDDINFRNRKSDIELQHIQNRLR